MSIELKPCPFCGAKAEMRYHPSCMCDPSHRSWEVGCSICDARVGNTIYAIGKTRDEAITDWNTRAERTCRAIPHDNLNESEGMGDAWEVCSECGALLAVITDNQTTPNYCPNCGAKVVDE